MNRHETHLNLVQRALQFEDLENFVDALKLTHLMELVKSGGPFTVFAPVNRAFVQMPETLVERIESQNNLLSTILQYHVVPGRFRVSELIEKTTRTTLIGQDVYPMQGKGHVWINEVKLLRGDLEASNGILHIVDRLLIPGIVDLKYRVRDKEERLDLMQAS